MPKVWRGLLATAVLGVAGAGAVAVAQSQAPAGSIPQTRPGFLAGYLPKGATPDSLVIVPPAPAPQSATQARDDAAAKAARAFANTPRWALAAQDADLRSPSSADAFSCALGVKIGPDTTPRLYLLMRRTLADAGLSTYPTKTRYQRPRPFMVRGGPICTPQDEAGLRKDGSYPSGHAALGWAWALVLAEAAPDRADAVLARGRAFMQSRVICNVHWQSDIEAGATMGAAVVARLHDEPAFRADLDAARAEIASVRASGQGAGRDCQAEAAALASAPLAQP
jgi:acid phosphatase (class A)